MNDEEAFQAALDADPYDQNTRGAFADWLEDRGDPRAAAVRELWRMGWAPFYLGRSWTAGNYTNDYYYDFSGRPDLSTVPQQWWARVRESVDEEQVCVVDEVREFCQWSRSRDCEAAVIAAYPQTEPVPA